MRRAIQAAHEISYSDFCRACAVSESALSNYETGRNLPSVALLLRIRQKFGTTTDYVYSGSVEGLPAIVTREIAKLNGAE